MQVQQHEFTTVSMGNGISQQTLKTQSTGTRRLMATLVEADVN
jgi:hypothetical protein